MKTDCVYKTRGRENNRQSKKGLIELVREGELSGEGENRKEQYKDGRRELGGVVEEQGMDETTAGDLTTGKSS